MRYLIVSDLHANLEALEAVVREAEGQYDRVLCCGDLVGYGADPNAVVEWVRANCTVVVRGNHDRACTGQEDLEWFNPVARAAAVWTQQALSAENAQYTADLPQGPILIDGLQVVHGSPFDEDEYVLAADEAGQAFGYLESRLAFFGHTHVPMAFIRDDGVERQRIDKLRIDSSKKYFINVGSVGQPRDGDWHAAYCIYHIDSAVVEQRRLKYDLKTAQKKIIDAGLPRLLAERLALGR